MRKMSALFVVAMLLISFSVAPGIALAGEHGGKEHGGGSEHGGGHMKGDGSLSGGEVGTLKATADALRALNPGLANQLEKIAEKRG